MIDAAALRVAVVGQPNSGKTSLFNWLTGSSQHVGNWPGVTVEKKEGVCRDLGQNIGRYIGAVLTDLPGIYSLSTYTLEEKVTRNFLLNDKPDLILNIVDGNNLERQLFLTVQILLMGLPMVVAVNMMDEVEAKGLAIDFKRLSELLGVPAVPVTAREGKGLDVLTDVIKETALCAVKPRHLPLPLEDTLHLALHSLAARLKNVPALAAFADWYALKLMESDEEALERVKNAAPGAAGELIKDAARAVTGRGGKPQTVVSDWIYGITSGVKNETVIGADKGAPLEKAQGIIDRIALNRYLGIPFFLLVMLGLFQVTFVFGKFLADWMGKGLQFLQGLTTKIPVDFIASFVTNGILGGVGNVVMLVPYVFFMFLFMTFFEDSGYMARAAFVMDRTMHRLGLHGKSFIPLVMGFGCNVPAIMAARTLENPQEKIKTALMIPFMLCSARLPVVVLISAAIFKEKGGVVVFFLYVLGLVIGILTGLLLKKTFLNAKSEGLIMELPPYRLPRFGNFMMNTWLKVKEYLIRAGTIIFIITLVLWVLSYFPLGAPYGGENSVIGLIGKAVSVVMAPLGFDWRMTVALITGFAAKEVVISTMGVLYGAGQNLGAVLATSMSPVVAFSFMVFILVYTPCLATVSVMRSETNSWKWTLFSVFYSLAAAWVLSFIITNAGRLIFGR